MHFRPVTISRNLQLVICRILETGDPLTLPGCGRNLRVARRILSDR
jgi:hypothetical protein